MALTLMVGMNGVGKDTIAKELIRSNPERALLNGTQILMKCLGIEVDIEVGFPPVTTREMYRQVEETPVDVKRQLCDTGLRDTLIDFKGGSRPGIMLSQLVVMKPATVNAPVEFQPQELDWYPEVFDKFVYVNAPIDQVAARREQDLRSQTRDRGSCSFEELSLHAAQYEVAWSALKSHVNNEGRTLEVNNGDGQLLHSVQAVDAFISA
jgi:adenylate kinase